MSEPNLIAIAHRLAKSGVPDVAAVAEEMLRLDQENTGYALALKAMRLHADNRTAQKLDRAEVFEYAISIGWPAVFGSQALVAKHFDVTPAAISYILKPRRKAIANAAKGV